SGGSVRGGREHGRGARRTHDLLRLRLGLEALIRVGAAEVRERRRQRLARLAVGHHRRELEARMRGDQAQPLAGPVAGTAEHHGGDAPAHCTAAAASPSASITRSPSAAPLPMALQAGTPIWVVMISTPTWLSVAGPVTTHGSMRKRSRSSFTPPQAATGSFADRMTALSAARISGHSRIASTP